MEQNTEILILDDLKERCNGRTRTMIRVLESFQGTSGPICLKLASPEANQDLGQLAKTLHTIKGLLQEIAAFGAAQALEQLEHKLRQENSLSGEDLAAVQTWVETANKAAEEAKEQLKQADAATPDQSGASHRVP